MGAADGASASARVARNLELVNLDRLREASIPGSCPAACSSAPRSPARSPFDPDLLLMDEPFGALDEIVRDHLNEQLLKLWAKTDKTVVFVTHSIPEAVFLSTRIVVMSPRPGGIHDVIEVDLPRERPLDIRETPEFLADRPPRPRGPAGRAQL